MRVVSDLLFAFLRPTHTPTHPHHTHRSANGSVYLWDLREPDYIHKRKQDKSLLVLRTPTYSTDHMSTDNHSCAIRRILPVGYNNILIGSGSGGDQDLSEQVCCFSCFATLFFSSCRRLY